MGKGISQVKASDEGAFSVKVGLASRLLFLLVYSRGTMRRVTFQTETRD